MSISATSSASSLMSTIRGQYQAQFAKLKETFQETGSIVGAETGYQSADGNVVISLRGFQGQDGKEYVDVTYKVDGAEASTLQQALGYGIDNETGLPVSADTQFGGVGMNGSAEVDDLDDFNALAARYTDMALETQDASNAKTKAWIYGDKTFTSIDDFRAFMRPQRAAEKAVQAMVDKMDFGSDAEMVDFMRKAENTLAQHLRSGGTTDISDFLAGLPEAALKAATKALGNSRAGSDGDKLLKILTDYLDASRKKAAERQADPTRRASVIDLLT